jgi:hypothetical protein
MTTPEAEYVEDHRRRGWRQARREWGSTAARLLMMSVGMAGGVWLTRDWASDSAATWVVVLCAGGAYLTGECGWRLARRLVAGPPAPPEPPQLVRTPVRGETAVVVSPHYHGGSAAQWAGAAAQLGVVTSSSVLDAVGPAAAVSAVLVGMGVTAVARTLSWSGPPRLALFADRVEIRRGLGRYVIPWRGVGSAGEQGGRAVIYVERPDLVSRRGWVRRPPAYGVPVGDLGVPVGMVVDAVERYRRDTQARAAISRPPLPLVVDDGTR